MLPTDYHSMSDFFKNFVPKKEFSVEELQTLAIKRDYDQVMSLLLAEPGCQINETSAFYEALQYRAWKVATMLIEESYRINFEGLCNKKSILAGILDAAIPKYPIHENKDEWYAILGSLLENDPAAVDPENVHAIFSDTKPSLKYDPEAVEPAKALLKKLKAEATGLDALSNCIIKEDTDQLSELLKQPDIDLNSVDLLGLAPIHWAVLLGNEKIISQLLSTKKPDLTVRATASGFTALHFAAMNGHTRIAAKLLEAGGSCLLNEQDLANESPLSLAFSNEHYDCAAMMLPLHDTPIDEKLTIEILDQNNMECVRALLQRPDVNMSARNYEGRTHVHRAAREGHAECLSLLLQYGGIDVNSSDEKGMTALFSASVFGHTECVRQLLQVPDINVNTADSRYNETALLRACNSGHTEVVKLLLMHPDIDVHIADKDGNTPLSKAKQNNHSEIIQLLQEAGAES